jgi:hypothetical protein
MYTMFMPQASTETDCSDESPGPPVPYISPRTKQFSARSPEHLASWTIFSPSCPQELELHYQRNSSPAVVFSQLISLLSISPSLLVGIFMRPILPDACHASFSVDPPSADARRCCCPVRALRISVRRHRKCRIKVSYYDASPKLHGAFSSDQGRCD